MSRNDTLGTKEKAIQLSQQLNDLLREFYEKTLEIKTSLVQQDSEDNLGRLNHLIAQREDIISRYNEAKREFELISGQFDLPELQKLLEEREAILKLIAMVDKENSVEINKLYALHKAKIKQINQGKKVFNAYNTSVSQIDGVFFDKRK